MSTVQNPKKSWLAEKSACSSVDASLGPIAPFRLWRPSPACHRQGVVLSAAGWLCSVLCPVSLPGGVLGLGFSWGSGDSYPTVWVATQPNSLRSPAGYSGPDLTLSNAACSSLSLPYLQVGDASVWAAAALGVAVRHLICGISLFIYFSFHLFCPLRFQGSPQTCQREFPGVWKILFFKTPFPGWISVLNPFVSLFTFHILSYLLLKTMGCLFGCLVSSVSIKRLFYDICSAFR